MVKSPSGRDSMGEPVVHTRRADIDFAECRLLKQSPLVTTLLHTRNDQHVIVRVPAAEPAAAQAQLRRLQTLYNGYDRHARVLEIIDRPAPAAIIEYVPGTRLREWLDERADRSMASALAAHFCTAHQRRRDARASEFLAHASAFADHSRGRSPSTDAVVDELKASMGLALQGIVQVPRVWAHADPSLSNIFVAPDETPRFIDRHRDFDWPFTDLALVVFVALKSRANPERSGQLGEFCAAFLEACDLDSWPSSRRQVAVLFWAAVALYLSMPDCVRTDGDWTHGAELATDLVAATRRSVSAEGLATVLCP